jgi:Fe2+ or Zn2+ uptake regulation protein
MSQQTVLQLLQELGGVATSSEIMRLAREKYPVLSLWQYVGNRLRKLRKWGFVGCDAITNEYFIIVQEEPEAAELLVTHGVKQ